MTTNELRQRATERISRLSDERLRVAEDFLAYLEEREEIAATHELLAIPSLPDALHRAEEEARQGQTTPWRSIRGDV